MRWLPMALLLLLAVSNDASAQADDPGAVDGPAGDRSEAVTEEVSTEAEADPTPEADGESPAQESPSERSPAEDVSSDDAAPDDAVPQVPEDASPGQAEPTEVPPPRATGPRRTPAVALEAPKVAIVVVGDPDDRLRGLARRIDEVLEPALRRPFDPGLRRALRGEPGQDDDGLHEVRRDRRRLSGAEAHDTPLLSTLGQRAGALVVAAVRLGDDGPELVILDVRHAAFYEGTLPLNASVEPARLVEFIGRRARAAAHVQALSPDTVAATTPVEADEPAPEEEEEEEEGFFEQFWPYFVAGLLLAGMIAVIIGTTADDQPDQPVLRFVPGGG